MEEIIGHLEEDLGMIVKLFVRFRPFRLRYLPPAVRSGANGLFLVTPTKR
ncbi:hypothetical protein HMPREF6485_2501 [Segatella buccae ATCC 33574]|uniref:Uncharacterized protein n=1 Tax=Segatella buccae ATCC 33574 TaxID=873513 RepID=E6KA65_9BACT|nr:hypothetical protein HMPREF6485_2501 [Segatella buccae ATCC 33574]